MDIWVAGISNYSVLEVLKLENIFQKSKVVTGKTPRFVIGLFF